MASPRAIVDEAIAFGQLTQLVKSQVGWRSTRLLQQFVAVGHVYSPMIPRIVSLR